MSIKTDAKLDMLAEINGMEVYEMLENAVVDSVVPGICVNEGCDYSNDVEPDQNKGYCELCDTNTVASCLILAGVM